MGMLLSLIVYILQIYSYVLIIYIFMSWFNLRNTTVGEFFARICEPYLEPFRRIVPPIGMIDISPIVAFIVLDLARNGIYQLFQWF
ncbi:YggT family protein [Heyndrickxia acidicola]|uniref:YggT family protein n=1 Tax=Heyndrickxia acidicola TaxID=209389 RepID=A0ABU6MBU9_9BACI|nr:YggT family protein [Heyndrickxia acidicola]MED1202151.1 YggT family protein [Heyndrickxia acidicola]